MNKLVKMYIKNKVCDFIRKSIYKIEITKKGKARVEKFQELTDNLWDKAENFYILSFFVTNKFLAIFFYK